MTGKLNPQISMVEVGVKELREVTIYPLSMADEKKMVSLISKEISVADKKMKNLTDVAAVKYVVDLIATHLQTIFKFVLDPDEEIKEEELTNSQLADIALLIYIVNFETVVVKLKAPIEKIKDRFQESQMKADMIEPSLKSSEPQVTD